MTRGQWHEAKQNFLYDTDWEGRKAIDFVAYLLEVERENLAAKYPGAETLMSMHTDALSALALLIGEYYTME